MSKAKKKPGWLTPAQIKKGFGKRGSLHKKLGIPANQKIGRARLQKDGSKAAQMALRFDYGRR